MKRYSLNSMLLRIIILIPTCLIMYAEPAVCGKINTSEAVSVAKLWYSMELNSGYLKISQSEVDTRRSSILDNEVLGLIQDDKLIENPSSGSEVLAYVIKFNPSGFVVVSGDDRMPPVIVFDAVSEFSWDIPDRNFLRFYLVNEMKNYWTLLRQQEESGAQIAVHSRWTSLRSRIKQDEFPGQAGFNSPGAPMDYVLWDTALWNQDDYYDDVVQEHNGGNNVPVGCGPLAGAIVMRFHSYPQSGAGAVSYTDNTGDIQYSHFVNFEEANYNWRAMPITGLNSPNLDVATLLYHCGVAVHENYEIGGSFGGFEAEDINNTFGYYGTIDQRRPNHAQTFRESILSRLPVEAGGGGHAIVVSGYRDTEEPYYYFNVGWGGHNNGWYSIYDLPWGEPPYTTIASSLPFCRPTNIVYMGPNLTGAEYGTQYNPYNSLEEGNYYIPVEGHLKILSGTFLGEGNTSITIDRPATIRTSGGNVMIGGKVFMSSTAGINMSSSGKIIIN